MVRNLANLKSVDLDGYEQLMEIPNFSKASSLEFLSVSGCVNLLSVHPSIFSLQSIEMLSLQDCRKLEKLPDIEEALPSSDGFRCKLGTLILQGCNSLKHLPHSLSKLKSLSFLALDECKQVDTSSLHIILDALPSLIFLTLDGCRNLYELPESISKLSSLEQLSLEETNVKSLPESIKHLPRLSSLSVRNCMRLQSILGIPASLNYLAADSCTALERLFTPTPELLEEHIRFQIENNDFLESSFSFGYCPNLDEDALDAILEYVECCNERTRAAFPDRYPREERLLED